MKIFTLLGLLFLLNTPSLIAANTGYSKLGSELHRDYQEYLSVLRSRGQEGDIKDAYAYCGYIRGVLDGDYEIEIPDNVTLDQIYAIVGKFLVNNPEVLHKNAALIVKFAIKRAF